MNSRDEQLVEIIMKYREKLQKKIRERKAEMEADHNDHYMLYNALGVTGDEGYQIDFQQNVGRFLYKYAGSLIEEFKKEHKRVKIIREAGYIPVRIMFFEPNRNQAIRIQAKLKDLYQELGGEYYSGDSAWEYLKNDTGIDLRSVIERNGK